MKIFRFSILIDLLATALLAYGQGQVTFNNGATTLISTNDFVNGPPTGPTAPYPVSVFYYALFVAPSTVSTVTGVTDQSWTFTGSYATNTLSASGGRLAGGQPILPAPYATGTAYNFLVRGWSASIGGQDWVTVQPVLHDLELGLAGGPDWFYGVSEIATITIGGGLNPTPPVFGNNQGTTIPGFLLHSSRMPEPSSAALVALGSLLVVLQRNRYGHVRDQRNQMARDLTSIVRSTQRI